MSKTRKEILTDFIQEVWNEGNLDAIERYLAPCYTVRNDPGDPWDGTELGLVDFKERVRLSRAPFPDQRFEIQQLFADGDAVVMTWLWSATHRGEIAGFSPTGKQIRMSGATVYDFEGDRLCGHWQIKDALSVYQQLRAAASGA